MDVIKQIHTNEWIDRLLDGLYERIDRQSDELMDKWIDTSCFRLLLFRVQKPFIIQRE